MLSSYNTADILTYLNAEMNRIGNTVIETFIDALDWNECIEKITEWGDARKSRTVCLCNVHSAVTATVDDALANALANSDMVLPDGAPIAWALRRKGNKNQPRIAGPDLMQALCNKLQKSGSQIFLFGASAETLDKLATNLNTLYPALKIAGKSSPKYGHWTHNEEESYVSEINNSGAGIIFVGLGCPKQEIWMINNREKIKGVMLGVGAAFDFHADTVKRAPKIYQRLGLEWLHRLLSEPKRLWKRYFITNSRFIYLIMKEQLTR